MNKFVWPEHSSLCNEMAQECSDLSSCSSDGNFDWLLSIFHNRFCSKKLIYYKNKDKLRKKIAKNGQQGAFKRFNSNVVAEYIINKTFKKKITKKFNWQV